MIGVLFSVAGANDVAVKATARRRPDLGVFRSNRERPIHRWYPFIEGYSAELVDQILRVHKDPGTGVFDPFGGSGTTALTAALAARDSYFCEVNPYLAWVALTKVKHAREAFASPSLGFLFELLRLLDSPEPLLPAKPHPLLVVDQSRRFFPDGVAVDVVGLLSWIEREVPEPACHLARLAVATSLIPSSNMIRRTDLRRRFPGDPPPAPFRRIVKDRLLSILEDVQRAGWMLGGVTQQVGTDVRALGTTKEPFGLIITSPPYLNGTNYCRNTKLELLALGFIPSEDDLGGLRAHSITAGINNVSGRRGVPARLDPVEAYATQVESVAYDQRIPAMIRGYFSDMKVALERIRANATREARFFLDIGDSRFAGVHIPTDELLAEIASSVGWRHVSTRLLRTRKSYDGTPLRQVLMEFVAG